MLVRYAHSRCAKSEIKVRRFPPLPGHLDIAFTPMMRDHALAPTLVWELIGGVRVAPDADSGPFIDPIAAALREDGFRLASQRLGDLVAPVVPGWGLVQHGDDLRLRPPDGSRADEFSGAMRALHLGWLDAVRRSKRVLVIYGSGFGLERIERHSSRYQISPRNRPRRSKSPGVCGHNPVSPIGGPYPHELADRAPRPITPWVRAAPS